MIALWVATAEAGSKADARRAARADPFSVANLAKTVAVIEPMVEEAAGRKFTTPPVVEVSSPEAIETVIREEDDLISAAVLRDTPEELRKQTIEARNHAIGGFLGKYAVLEKKLFLARTELTEAAGDQPVQGFIEIVLAHELTHALQDQQVDLASQVRALADQDALWAASGTWEGLATWVSEKVAAKLGFTPYFDALCALQGWSPAGLQQKGAYPIWAIYGRGRDAIAWHAAHGGLDEVWAVASHPPESSRGLFEPATWPAARSAGTVDYPAVLRTTEQQLTDGPWVVGISALGEFQLRQEAVVAGDEPAFDQVLAHLVDSWSLTAERPDRRAEIRILAFDDPGWPARYLELVRAQSYAADAQIAGLFGREVEVRWDPFDQVPGDAAVLRVSQVTGTSGTATEHQAAWVVRGNTVVAVAASSFRPGLRMGWAVEEVFRRLDAARAGEPLPAALGH